MAAPQPLSRIQLPAEEVRLDRKKCSRYDQCGLGQKAIYMGSAFSPRKYYIPYEAVTHVFKRVAASNGAGRGFLAPILYLVVRYDDGKEQQCSFRYLQDADKMMDQLQREHPSIHLLSPEGEKKAEAKRLREEKIEHAALDEAQEHAVRLLNNARLDLEKRPSLYDKLAAAARAKRTQDLIRPGYQQLAVILFVAGAVILVVGLLLLRRQGGSIPVLIALIGAALMFMMFNSRVLPTPGHNRKSRDREYQAALEAMKRNLRGLAGWEKNGFPLPAAYAHPVVLDRMIRIIREGRARDIPSSLEVLKLDLKAADASVALSGREYEEVVLIKPLFTVNDYR